MFEITGRKSEVVGEQNLISLLLFLTGPPPSSLLNPGAPSPSPPASPLTPAPVLLFTGTQRLSPEQKGTVLWPCLCGLPGPRPFAGMGGSMLCAVTSSFQPEGQSPLLCLFVPVSLSLTLPSFLLSFHPGERHFP